MGTRTAIRFVYVIVTLWAAAAPAAAEEFTEAIRSLLQDHVDLEQRSVGVVVGMVDERGSRVVSYGRTRRDGGADVDGDTVFEIGSITKTFTALLLADMVERGEVGLDDPVAKYLPESVKVPARNGKQITLLHLATHASGLPHDQDNFAPRDWENPYADYTDEQLYAFLACHTLSRDPGEAKDYSNIGYGLLGHVLAQKAAKDYESLVVERICDPLWMDGTRVTLDPEMKTRAAAAHSWYGEPLNDMVFHPTLMGNGALHSTANDMLKFVSANLGLTRSRLTPSMQQTHVVRFKDMGLGWGVSGDWVSHAGSTLGSASAATFDTKRRRGVVVLSNKGFDYEGQEIARVLLQSDWHSDKRPEPVALDPGIYDSYEGQYRLGTDPIMTVRRAGSRLFIQQPGQPLLELLPESETRFFLRVSGKAVTFVRDAARKVTALTSDVNGAESTFVRISDRPPAPRVVPKLPILATVDEKTYDACAGEYKFKSGRSITVSRRDDHLVAVYRGWFGFNLFPESDTKFYCRCVPLVVSFVRNDEGEVEGLSLSCQFFPNPLTGKADRI